MDGAEEHVAVAPTLAKLSRLIETGTFYIHLGVVHST